MNEEVLRTFQYWIRERENIFLRRGRGEPPPWTTDPILANYRFCNVRREDDTVTVWIRKNIRERYAGHPNLFLMLCIGRLINWPPTLEYLIRSDCWPVERYDPDAFEEALRRRAESTRKVWTGAYLLGRSPGGRPRHFSQDVIRSAWEALPRIRWILPFGLQSTHEALRQCGGWGNFLAYQVVVDARFTALLCGAPDVHDWAAAGPGTCAGLNWLHGRDPRKGIPQAQALEEMHGVEPRFREVGVDFDFSDVPNILCEGSKYLRMRAGGRMRARYRPPRWFGRPR